MKNCPRCSSEISKNDKVCPRCGLPVSQMEEYEKKFNLSSDESNVEEVQPVLTKQQQKEKRKEEKKQKKEEKKAQKKKALESEEIDFSQFATNSGVPDPDEILESDTYAERRKKKKKLAAKPRFIIDENGEFDISTKDVEVVGEETGKIIGEQFEQSYSIKKSRGDYIPPKIKWWEIYKFTDRHFARAKIKKEVNKASKIKPSFVKKSKLLLLAIFLGWTGAHNFYAKNKRKGWVSIVSLIVWVGVTALSNHSSFFQSIAISVGGFAGFINMFIWISDIINIISNSFRYKFQRDRFIAGLNVETRAKLGEKYIDMDLYRKPWWVRFRVWCEKRKRNHQIRQRERRQANIEKEKRKIAEAEERARIESEISEFESKENDKLKKDSSPSFVEESTLQELKTFENENDVQDFENSSNSTTESSEDLDKLEVEQSENIEDSKKKYDNNITKKYAKTVKNKKAEKRKRKK